MSEDKEYTKYEETKMFFSYYSEMEQTLTPTEEIYFHEYFNLDPIGSDSVTKYQSASAPLPTPHILWAFI